MTTPPPTDTAPRIQDECYAGCNGFGSTPQNTVASSNDGQKSLPHA